VARFEGDMLSSFATKFAMLAVPEFITEHFNWLLGGAIVLAGLLVGMRDLLRFSGYRSWAISSVSFSESIRRRVLLITPVAILGIIIVSQLQNPVDAQDAIRQTVKVALFATGMVVVIATIIMACTNLPKEIESRVIYTVVTKPTTRLEIVIGKILGFAKVSALLLLIMGLFTWGYVQFRAWNFGREIKTILAENRVEDAAGRATMEHYAAEGLLNARKYEWSDRVQVLSRIPGQGDNRRWVYGRGEQDILVPFVVQPGALIGPGYEQISAEIGAVVLVRLEYVQHEMTAEEMKMASEEGLGGIDLGVAVTTEGGPLAPSATTKPARAAPQVSIQFLDRNRNSLVTNQQVNGGKPITLPPGGQPIEARLSGQGLAELSKVQQFFVQITGLSPATEYGLNLSGDSKESPVRILIPGAAPGQHREIQPATEDAGPMHAEFRGRLGTDGQQLRGGEAGKVPVAIYAFRGAQVKPRADGNVAFEFTSTIEKGGDEPADADIPTRVQVSITDAKTGQTNGPIELMPESNRTVFFNVPAAWLGGGDYDAIVRVLTNGHWATVRSDGIAMVVENQPFAFNLFKSLLVMWLLSMLVIVVSLFCSTFLSWPIAIVLTLVILLGKWGVDQLGDTGSGLGNQVATDMGFRDPSTAKVVSTSVEALNRFLTTVSSILPDIGAFGGTESVERGISIPPADVYRALLVLIAFGIPLMAMSYIFLKNKEVAP
jgi:ABC-type transport system involved in multi-copper enzyme maturation permease subunit